AQRIYVPAAPSHDRNIIGDSLEGFGRMPHRAFDACGRHRRLNATTEVDIVDHFWPRELPWIAEGQPFLRVLLLPAIPDDLAEQSVVVTDPVTVSRNSEARHALEETGGEPPEAAMAKRRVRLNGSQPIQIDTQIPERIAKDLGATKVAEAIGKKSPN